MKTVVKFEELKNHKFLPVSIWMRVTLTGVKVPYGFINRTNEGDYFSLHKIEVYLENGDRELSVSMDENRSLGFPLFVTNDRTDAIEFAINLTNINRMIDLDINNDTIIKKIILSADIACSDSNYEAHLACVKQTINFENLVVNMHPGKSTKTLNNMIDTWISRYYDRYINNTKKQNKSVLGLVKNFIMDKLNKEK